MSFSGLNTRGSRVHISSTKLVGGNPNDLSAVSIRRLRLLSSFLVTEEVFAFGNGVGAFVLGAGAFRNPDSAVEMLSFSSRFPAY